MAFLPCISRASNVHHAAFLPPLPWLYRICHLRGVANVMYTDTHLTRFPALPSVEEQLQWWHVVKESCELYCFPRSPCAFPGGKTSSPCWLTRCCCLLIVLVKLIKLLVTQLYLCLLQFYYWACPQTISSESLKHLQASSTLTCHELSVPKGLGRCWIVGLWTDVGREEERGKSKMCCYMCIEKGKALKFHVTYFCGGQWVHSVS